MKNFSRTKNRLEFLDLGSGFFKLELNRSVLQPDGRQGSNFRTERLAVKKIFRFYVNGIGPAPKESVNFKLYWESVNIL